jgi:hypothetical protein
MVPRKRHQRRSAASTSPVAGPGGTRTITGKDMISPTSISSSSSEDQLTARHLLARAAERRQRKLHILRLAQTESARDHLPMTRQPKTIPASPSSVASTTPPKKLNLEGLSSPLSVFPLPSGNANPATAATAITTAKG